MRSAVVRPPKQDSISYARWIGAGVLLCAGICIAGACSVEMEKNRPIPVDISQFSAGDTRDSVRMRLGIPANISNEAGYDCDTYNLYTRGVGEIGRAPIMAGEMVADMFSLGLAEAVLTPAEKATAAKRYPVKFCYKGDTLANVTESETPLEE